MTQETLMASQHAAEALVRAAAAFAREGLPEAPDGLLERLATCSEVLVSVCVYPFPALRVSGSGPAGLVLWEITLQPTATSWI